MDLLTCNTPSLKPWGITSAPSCVGATDERVGPKSTTSSLECFFSFDHFGLELDEEDGLGRPKLVIFSPMGRYAVCREASSITDAFDDATDKGSAVELTHLLGNTDVCVDKGVIVDDHVIVVVASAGLESVGGAAKQRAP